MNSNFIIKIRADREFDNKYGPRRYQIIELPESEWYTCPSCKGSGSYLMQENLHESAGWVPCRCSGGKIKMKTVEIPRRVRVPAGSRKI